MLAEPREIRSHRDLTDEELLRFVERKHLYEDVQKEAEEVFLQMLQFMRAVYDGGAWKPERFHIMFKRAELLEAYHFDQEENAA